MRQDNIFVNRGTVAGESFIGYEGLYKTLYRNVICNRGNFALVGLNQMGKTSLIKKLYAEAINENNFSKFIPVIINLKELRSKNGKTLFDSLLINIAKEIKHGLACRISLDGEGKKFCYQYDKFEKATADSDEFRILFKNLCEEIKFLDKHIILSLDKFDYASKNEIFKETADYEFFRDLTDSSYAVSLILISRQRLYAIEKKNENNSTFRTSFKEIPLIGFSKHESELFFEILNKDYEIVLSSEQRERIKYYAGRSPYIYSCFGYELVEEKIDGQENFDIDKIYKEKINSDVSDYAETLYERLKSDEHLGKLMGILFGPSINITQRDIDLLSFMGYLNTDTRDEFYSALSGYFTDFLHTKYYCEDSWQNIIEVEKFMKKIVTQSFIPLEESQWKKVLDNAYSKNTDSSQTFNYGLYKTYIENNFKNFDQHSTLIDVISLKDTFEIIHAYWQEVFQKYFEERKFDTFQNQFKMCARARNPLAHGHKEYLTKSEQEQVNVYCNEILDIVKKCLKKIGTPVQIDPLAELIDTPIISESSSNNSQVTEENLNKEGILTDIVNNKGKGIKGNIFNAKGTIAKSLLKDEKDELSSYEGKSLKVKVIGLNPQKDQYILKLVE